MTELQSQTDTETVAEETDPDTSHLDDIEDGCGCTEVWEHLSENREASSD